MKQWGDVMSGIGAVALSLLSCAICPMCLPLYAGLLSLVGIELVEIHAIFFPLAIGFSVLTLGFMAYQIHCHQGAWLPFKLALGLLGGVVLAIYFDYDYFLYFLLILFMGCVLWNRKLLVHTGKKCC